VPCGQRDGYPTEMVEALGFTQALTEMSTGNIKKMFLRSKVRPVRRADALGAIYEPIV
jgi:hypothetical protein